MEKELTLKFVKGFLMTAGIILGGIAVLAILSPLVLKLNLGWIVYVLLIVAIILAAFYVFARYISKEDDEQKPEEVQPQPPAQKQESNVKIKSTEQKISSKSVKMVKSKEMPTAETKK